MLIFMLKTLIRERLYMTGDIVNEDSMKLIFRGSGTKIVDSAFCVTHEMPEIYVEAESVEEGYEIARFKYHDIGYNIVHSLLCINAKRNV